jgi:predicted enzyme related to lactoylglutathione lyase
MDTNTNSINWFEIPVSDLQRAKHFYQVAFGIHMNETEMTGIKMAIFPYEMGSGKTSGALVESDFHKPGQDGAILYLNANPSMDAVLERIEAEGGKKLMAKTQISPEVGYMAFFLDSEGNRIALHSQN